MPQMAPLWWLTLYSVTLGSLCLFVWWGYHEGGSLSPWPLGVHKSSTKTPPQGGGAVAEWWWKW
uniref:ATP synthase F0 subunit 8 n=1 Tax=Doru luteipes TaxID=1514967 RepID=A0A2U8XC94_9NEOP|nr:ATP synthase F0 subunit 8 [Doru luteipes]